jgi:hypothetical protein
MSFGTAGSLIVWFHHHAATAHAIAPGRPIPKEDMSA